MSSDLIFKLPEITSSSDIQSAVDYIKSTFTFPDFEIVDQGIGEYFIGSKRVIERTFEIELNPSITNAYEISILGNSDLFVDFLGSLYSAISDLLFSYFAQFKQASTRGVICPTPTSHSITKKFDVSLSWDKDGNEKVSGTVYLTFEEK